MSVSTIDLSGPAQQRRDERARAHVIGMASRVADAVAPGGGALWDRVFAAARKVIVEADLVAYRAGLDHEGDGPVSVLVGARRAALEAPVEMPPAVAPERLAAALS